MKHTTRLDNQHLVDKIKQDFSKQQRNKLPSIIATLPSAGKIYPESSPLRSGKIEMRYMTAYDEDILTNMSYIKEGVLFDKLLESIIVSDIDVKEIAPVDKNGLIIYARILSYGADYPVNVIDPATSKTIQRTVDLTKIGYKPFDLQSDENGEFTYQVNDTTSIKYTYTSNLNDDDSISQLLQKIIRQVNDSRKSGDIENFLQYEFFARDAKKFRTYYADTMPGLNLDYEFEGENGGTFIAGFPIGTDLFWF
jgi:hypothetical protein